ncbi:MAG: hypothetical protein IT548_08375 [Alphaproteobacteria bacterium]|nr:hypothetical protein [Alphaproteobacteria bacterium]
MIPEIPGILNWAAGRILTEIAPHLPAGYGQASTGTLAMMLVLSAQEYEHGADTRVWENTRMRAILAKGGMETDPPDGSLLMSALTAANNRLRSDLIRLHEAVEEGASADKALEQEILQFLKESADRRRLHVA